GPYELDSRRCISYWTIEHRGALPDDVADSLHGWAFGCDICQEVCPWNRKAPPGREEALLPIPGRANANLVEWLGEDPVEFARSWKGTALSRAKRSGLLRNAAAILGSRQVQSAVGPLSRCLSDADPVVRTAAAQALGRIGGESARIALTESENDQDTA